MKKVFIVLGMVMLFGVFGCTPQQRARTYGGRTVIELPAGEKLVEATWKENSLWYLTEPMEDGYEPKSKTFQESSQFGIMEGTVVFVEKRK